jgi:streptogramin lyase
MVAGLGFLWVWMDTNGSIICVDPQAGDVRPVGIVRRADFMTITADSLLFLDVKASSLGRMKLETVPVVTYLVPLKEPTPSNLDRRLLAGAGQIVAFATKNGLSVHDVDDPENSKIYKLKGEPSVLSALADQVCVVHTGGLAWFDASTRRLREERVSMAPDAQRAVSSDDAIWIAHASGAVSRVSL